MTLLVLLSCMPRVPKADVLYTWSEAHHAGARSLEDIDRDRVVFRETCGECHLPPAARWYSMDDWPRIVEKMRTREHAKFDDATREQVLRYLHLAHAWDAAVRADKRATK
jgi:hypothetical protein